ncbi:DUF1700 domain-containing protein [Acholeplasma laidlawii]|uniref:DUF1700 domain-containing protein n=1 Tax=Acholeplasma laidlawii TaxID=2148 RepID=UPI0018C2589A|nr:DUF1700 domain-containing protein [Acholeplasma laidlawii]MBG0762668.1 DUF1700 domain-containing protein [Acholeplasma laidlawii]
MNKRDYLNKIREYFSEKEVTREDINTVVEDYAELYDEALELGLTDEQVAHKLGNPRDIYDSIKDTLHYVKSKDNRIVAVMPFISTILFFLVGFLLNGWAYAWIFYLLIPIAAISINTKSKEKIVALSPFIATITFFTLGFVFGLWHPGWLIFLIVPVSAIVLNARGKEKIIGLSPFAFLIIYILVSTYVIEDFYQYGWSIFALIPVIAILTQPIKLKDIFMISTILLAMAAHITIYFTIENAGYVWMVYLVPTVVGILLGYIQVISGDKVNVKEKIWVILAMLLVVITYLLVSFLIPNIWTWSWIILLLIPMIGIYDGTKFEHPVAYMPFIAVTIFMLLGSLGNYWQYAWLVFLIIPITAILTESGDKTNEVKEDTDETSDC